MERKSKQHDSYGCVSLSRVQSSGSDLFGSSISNTNLISLKINKAEETESFGKTRHSATDRIVEVYLSPNQFSELITTMNVSEGVPCTINWLGGEGSIQSEKRTNKREVTEEYMTEILSELMEKISNLREFAESLKKKSTVSKKEREKLSFDLSILQGHFESNIPFVEKIFHEVMDKAVVEAKSDIDSFITHAVTELGLESLEQKRNLLED